MNAEIANILKGYIVTLPFADKVGGLVKTVTYVDSSDKGSVKKTMPVDCGVTHAECLKGKYTDLIPNSKYKSVIYFEDGGSSPSGSTAAGFNFEAKLKLVCWLNLQKTGKTGCQNTGLAIATILNTLPISFFNSGIYSRMQIVVESQDIKSPAIFGKYTYDESQNQYLMYPYDYFALNLSIKFTITKGCITNWVNSAAIACVDNENE